MVAARVSVRRAARWAVPAFPFVSVHISEQDVMASDSRVSESEDTKKPDDGQQPKSVPVRQTIRSQRTAPEAGATAAGRHCSRPAARGSRAGQAAGASGATKPAVEAPRPACPSAPPDAGDDPAAGMRPSRGRHPWWSRRFWLFQAVPSWLVSMVFHAVLLMMLAVVTLPEQAAATRIVAVANPTDIEEVENLEQRERLIRWM